MRSPEDVFQDMERDRAQREGEIRLIENVGVRLTEDREKEMVRRSLVLLTYAHLEGFCRFALLAYAASVNSAKVPCSEAITPLVASTLSRAFAALRDVNSKHPAFKNLPEDRGLHLVAREQTFVEKYEELAAQAVDIPDKLVDMRSNMTSLVLKRNLYVLGLDYPSVDKHSGTINKLVNKRNAIAHGDLMEIPSEEEAKGYVVAAFDVMRFVQQETYEALKKQAYRRREVPEEAAVAAEAG
jgi:hypothetical protein